MPRREIVDQRAARRVSRHIWSSIAAADELCYRTRQDQNDTLRDSPSTAHAEQDHGAPRAAARSARTVLLRHGCASVRFSPSTERRPRRRPRQRTPRSDRTGTTVASCRCRRGHGARWSGCGRATRPRFSPLQPLDRTANEEATAPAYSAIRPDRNDGGFGPLSAWTRCSLVRVVGARDGRASARFSRSTERRTRRRSRRRTPRSDRRGTAAASCRCRRGRGARWSGVPHPGAAWPTGRDRLPSRTRQASGERRARRGLSGAAALLVVLDRDLPGQDGSLTTAPRAEGDAYRGDVAGLFGDPDSEPGPVAADRSGCLSGWPEMGAVRRGRLAAMAGGSPEDVVSPRASRWRPRRLPIVGDRERRTQKARRANGGHRRGAVGDGAAPGIFSRARLRPRRRSFGGRPRASGNRGMAR